MKKASTNLLKNGVRQIGWIIFVAAMFILAAYLVSFASSLLLREGFLRGVDGNIVSLVTQSTMSVVAALLIFFGSRLVREKMTLEKAGVSRSIEWRDIGWWLIGAVFYIALTVGLALLAKEVIPGYDADQAQDVGVSGRLFSTNLLIAFFVFVVIVPFFEELIFRGFLYGGLRSRKMPVFLAILVVSALFALAHGQWNVAVDTFALSVVMCALREKTGAIWAGVLLHALKNFIAFYLVFVVGMS